MIVECSLIIAMSLTQMRKKPDILATRIVAQSEIFSIEQVDLHFENGEARCFERLRGRRGGAVMVVPMLDEDTVLLVREYAVGTEQYEIGCPKGIIEAHESVIEGANRELMEEIGYGAKRLTRLKKMSTAPGYLTSRMELVLAEDLFEQRLEGDEPEPIEVVPWKLSNLSELFERQDVTEARSIAALFLVRDLMKAQ